MIIIVAMIAAKADRVIANILIFLFHHQEYESIAHKIKLKIQITVNISIDIIYLSL